GCLEIPVSIIESNSRRLQYARLICTYSLTNHISKLRSTSLHEPHVKVQGDEVAPTIRDLIRSNPRLGFLNIWKHHETSPSLPLTLEP
ncbi:hypothetical protein BGZ52_004711, partial [Haplosporangium bisporale]